MEISQIEWLQIQLDAAKSVHGMFRPIGVFGMFGIIIIVPAVACISYIIRNNQWRERFTTWVEDAAKQMCLRKLDSKNIPEDEGQKKEEKIKHDLRVYAKAGHIEDKLKGYTMKPKSGDHQILSAPDYSKGIRKDVCKDTLIIGVPTSVIWCLGLYLAKNRCY